MCVCVYMCVWMYLSMCAYGLMGRGMCTGMDSIPIAWSWIGRGTTHARWQVGGDNNDDDDDDDNSNEIKWVYSGIMFVWKAVRTNPIVRPHSPTQKSFFISVCFMIAWLLSCFVFIRPGFRCWGGFGTEFRHERHSKDSSPPSRSHNDDVVWQVWWCHLTPSRPI